MIIKEERKKLRTYRRRYSSFEMGRRDELTSLCIKLEEYEEMGNVEYEEDGEGEKKGKRTVTENLW